MSMATDSRFVDDGVGLVVDGVRLGIDPTPAAWLQPPPDNVTASAKENDMAPRTVSARRTGNDAGNPRAIRHLGKRLGRQLDQQLQAAAPGDNAPPADPAPAPADSTTIPPQPADATTQMPDAAPAFADGDDWRALMLTEGVETGDGRLIEPGATTFRDYPMPFMWQPENQVEHDGAVFVGQLTRTEQVGDSWWGFGTLDLEGDDGAEFTRILAKFSQFGVSVDMDEVEIEFVFPEADVTDDSADGYIGEDDIQDLLFDEPAVAKFTACRVMGLTATPFPAFPSSFVELNPALTGADPNAAPTPPVAPTTPTTPVAPAARASDVITASGLDTLLAAAAPIAPPGEWFNDPGLTEPTPLRVTPEGRVYGHLALWGTCHVGFQGTCVTPPHSQRGYSDFHLGAIECADGDEIACGHITLGTGHASKALAAADAAQHYDDTGSQVAAIRCGEDQHGIWFAGALKSHVSPEQVATLRSAPLSGDWRTRGAGLELIASLAVNVPGFPVPRTGAFVACGQQTSLVAAGVLSRGRVEAAKHRQVQALAAEALDARIGRNTGSRLDALDAAVHGTS